MGTQYLNYKNIIKDFSSLPKYYVICQGTRNSDTIDLFKPHKSAKFLASSEIWRIFSVLYNLWRTDFDIHSIPI